MATANDAPSPRLVEPMRPKGYQDGSPFTAHHMTELLQQSAALVRRASLSSMNYVWPAPVSFSGSLVRRGAPFAQVSASNTWTDFKFTWGAPAATTHDCDLPWYMSRAASKVEARLRILTEHNVAFAARLSSKTLVDSVATVNGDPSSASKAHSPDVPHFYSVPTYPNPTLSFWDTRNPAMVELVCAVTPTLPASRIVAMQPQLQVISNGSLGTGVDLGALDFWLVSASIYDVPDEETVG